jgi:hypothetical protein
VPCGILPRVSARVMSHPGIRHRTRSDVRRLGLLVIALALAFRIWSLAGSWFYFDDLAFLSAGTNDPLSWHFIGRNYAGHLMPAGWLVIKGLATWAPYQWGVWAGFLVALQAVASLGMLRLLRSMFGETRLVLVLLAGYCFYVFTLPAGVWFAAGINQLPLQVALVFGVHAHLSYLRTHRWQSLVVTLAWTVVGLAFYEKAAILFGFYAILALGWFARGKLTERLSMLWRDYPVGIIAHGAVAVPYVAIYLKFGLHGTQPASTLLSSVGYRLVAVAFSTGVVGGPFEWRSMSANSLADPSDLISLGSWVAVGSLVYYAYTTRTASRRAWSLIAFSLAANVYLLSSARADLVGPDIGLEYRYQTESAAIFVLALGLAFLPLIGAPEVNRLREGVPRPHERPVVIRTVTIVVVAFSLVSSLAYVRNWQDHNPTEPYFDQLAASIADTPGRPLPLVDLSLPQNLLWAFGYPENTDSHIFKALHYPLYYPDSSVDRLYAIKDDGELTQAIVLPARTMVGGSGCGYVLHRAPTEIPLDGPVVGGGWWIRMEYGAPRAFAVRIGMGSTTMRMRLPAGAHTAYFKADGSYNTVRLANDAAGRSACITHLVLGNAVAQLPTT